MTWVKIPLEIIEIPPFGVHCLVKAVVGDEHINLVLDTGASRTIFDSRFISGILGPDALTESQDPSAAIGINDLQSYLVEIPDFWIGGLFIPGFAGIAMDLSNIIESYEMMGLPEIAGILGGDVLLEFAALIDYSKGILRLKAGSGTIV